MVGKMCEVLVAAEHNQPGSCQKWQHKLTGITTQQLSGQERGKDKAVHF